MTAANDETCTAQACERCARRGWLLERLSPLLDRVARDRGRLFALLELTDEELIEALAGSRRDALRTAYAALDPSTQSSSGGIQTTCPHRLEHPRALAGEPGASLLFTLASRGRLRELTDAPVVAVLGCRTPSDYGRQMALSIARELSACGVTVVSCAADGVGEAAQAGALHAGSHALALFGDGLTLARRGPHGALVCQIARRGCALSELPGEASGHIWGHAAAERLAVELAQLVVLVEGEENTRELAAARKAQELGRPLAAVPGRANSLLAGAPHALLREGACLVTGGAELLELLPAPRDRRAASPAHERVGLEPLLRGLLEDVGSGRDSAEALLRHRHEPLEQILLGLTRLELMGFLARGRGGRYVPAGTPRASPPADT